MLGDEVEEGRKRGCLAVKSAKQCVRKGIYNAHRLPSASISKSFAFFSKFSRNKRSHDCENCLSLPRGPPWKLRCKMMDLANCLENFRVTLALPLRLRATFNLPEWTIGQVGDS